MSVSTPGTSVEGPVDPCTGSGQEVAYFYSFCSSSTEVTEVEGFCEASGQIYYTLVVISSCTAASDDIFDIEEERLAQKYCHECSEGIAVCSSSSEHAEVCGQVATKTECTAGLTYQDTRFSCSSETGEIEVAIAGCKANGTYVAMDLYSGLCSDWYGTGYGGDHVCYECDGFGLLCGPPNSSCGELVGDTTASSSAFAALCASDLLVRVAAAFCGIELLGGLLVLPSYVL